MNLIQLDPTTRTVLAVLSLEMAVPLTVYPGDVVLAEDAPAIGTVFNPATQTFSSSGRRRWITKLAFDSRFNMAEAVTLKLAQAIPARNEGETAEAFQARCEMAASVQVLQSRLNMASYIDLDREDTRQGVMLLESMGLLAAGRALAILDMAVAEHEYHPGA